MNYLGYLGYLGTALVVVFLFIIAGINAEGISKVGLNLSLGLESILCIVFLIVFTQKIKLKIEKKMAGLSTRKLNPQSIYQVIKLVDMYEGRTDINKAHTRLVFILQEKTIGDYEREQVTTWEVHLSCLRKPNLSLYEDLDVIPRFFKYQEESLSRGETFVILTPLTKADYDNSRSVLPHSILPKRAKLDCEKT